MEWHTEMMLKNTLTNEEFIKLKSDQLVEKIRSELKTQGLYLTQTEESYIRFGIAYGITLSSLLLANVDPDLIDRIRISSGTGGVTS